MFQALICLYGFYNTGAQETTTGSGWLPNHCIGSQQQRTAWTYWDFVSDFFTKEGTLDC
jgi:hypothetical protein